MIKKVSSPLARTLVSEMRDMTLPSQVIRNNIASLAQILVNEASNYMLTERKKIKTWKEEIIEEQIKTSDVVFIPIIRGGLPMLDGALTVLPNCEVGFLSTEKSQITLESSIVMEKLPVITGKTVCILDTMVGTGGTLANVISRINNLNPKKVIVLSIVTGPIGLKRMADEFPNVLYLFCCEDKVMDAQGFLRPGMGDMGDRCFQKGVFM